MLKLKDDRYWIYDVYDHPEGYIIKKIGKKKQIGPVYKCEFDAIKQANLMTKIKRGDAENVIDLPEMI